MTIGPRQKIVVSFGLATLTVVAAVSFMVFVQLPHIHSLRATIDGKRAALAALQDQQSNLLLLRQESEQINAAQSRLDEEIWKFATEDSFYTRVSTIGKNAGVTIDDPKVSEATPTGQPLVRNVTLTIHGKLPDVWRAVQAIQNTKPLIAIQSASLLNGASATLIVSGTSVWQ